MTLNAAVLDEARALGVNVSRAAEAGVAQAVKAARAERWRRDNAEAIAAHKRWIEENGVPLSEYREF